MLARRAICQVTSPSFSACSTSIIIELTYTESTIFADAYEVASSRRAIFIIFNEDVATIGDFDSPSGGFVGLSRPLSDVLVAFVEITKICFNDTELELGEVWRVEKQVISGVLAMAGFNPREAFFDSGHLFL